MRDLSISVRRASIADLRSINDLYNRCYGFSRPLAEAEWLYARNLCHRRLKETEANAAEANRQP